MFNKKTQDFGSNSRNWGILTASLNLSTFGLSGIGVVLTAVVGGPVGHSRSTPPRLLAGVLNFKRTFSVYNKISYSKVRELGMMSVNQVLEQVCQIARSQLRGMRRFRFEAAMMGVITMRGLMESSLADMTGAITFRDQRWNNVQAELQNVKRLLQRLKIELPQKLQADLDYYCRCPTPEEY